MKNGYENDLQKFEEQAFYKEFWLFNYTNRYIFDYLEYYELRTLIIGSFLEKARSLRQTYTTPHREDDDEYFQHLYDQEFLNCLIYSYHRINFKDGFNDIKYNDLLIKYNNPYKMVSTEHHEFIRLSHDLTTKFGYLYLALLTPPDRSFNWDVFINKTIKIDFDKFLSLIFPYERFGETFKGIQINIRKYTKDVFLKSWDLSIHFKADTPISKLRKLIKEAYPNPLTQTIGEENSADISVYIARKDISPSKVVKYIEAQVNWLKMGIGGRNVAAVDDSGQLLIDYAKKILIQSERDRKKYIDIIKVTSGLNEKTWPIIKNNIRRAIGLHHWDIITSMLDSNGEKIKLERLLKVTYERLADETPALLNYYRHGYYCENTEKFKISTAEAYKTIISEMRKDYTMTVACIESYSYLSPEDTKNLKRLDKEKN